MNRKNDDKNVNKVVREKNLCRKGRWFGGGGKMIIVMMIKRQKQKLLSDLIN